MSCISDFDDYPFSLPQNWWKRIDFWNFSSQVKMRYLRQPYFKFLQQLNDYSKNHLAWKLVDDFLVSFYASFTTKSSNFVWSITSQNLNQFQKILFVGIFSTKSSVCLLNLRKIWGGGLTGWASWHGMAQLYKMLFK